MSNQFCLKFPNELYDLQLRDIISESNILPLSTAVAVTISFKEENPLFCQLSPTDTAVSVTADLSI